MYEALVCKHEEYAALIIEDDEAYEKEEEWLADCQHTFLKLEVDAKMFIESIKKPGSNDLDVNGDLSKGKESASSHVDKQGISNMQSQTPSTSDAPDNDEMPSIQSVEQAGPEISIKKGANSVQVINSGKTADDKPINTESNVNKITSTAGTEKLQQSPVDVGACMFKLEKPKLPVFAGNVRDYAIFRSDFNHAIEAKYSKRDSITLLHTCLRDKPLELIKGIRSDYDAAWEYLDSIYGRGHTMDNCKHKQQCTKLENGTRCPRHHHQLLHKSNPMRISVAITASPTEAILPVLSANIGSGNSFLNAETCFLIQELK